ncbi:winged helix-turn-helix domain-containing tetratricopeptide repeat protein [Novosphingobium album (ex Hu et al. 2023)]|nr:winged helix-turn-helix domain-containing protein [Novosphingobium album (ex Hu et al. 2023)]
MSDLFVNIHEEEPRLPASGSFTYRFEGFELDTARFELRAAGTRVPVEPQVLSLLILLVQNLDRLVSKDELVEKIWDGRIVSESAVAARIKAARKALGDDGSQQRLIRTIHGKGFRFVGLAAIERQEEQAVPGLMASVTEPERAAAGSERRDGRPTLAVLPFQLLGEPGPHDIIADALPADLIMDLSRLHSLFVIARGSSFRFRGADADPVSVGRAFGVRYCVTGTIERAGPDVTVSVTLADTSDGSLVWAERYRGEMRGLQQLRPEIASHVITNLAVLIPQNEARLARGRPASALDAWSSFHLGLDHMYRFNKADNAQAAGLFDQALALDPYFSLALGGRSFTHFQNAFLLYGGDPEAEAEKARMLAQRAVEADRLDPFAHFNVGRCCWLDGNLQDSLDWFDRATSLSPNYAQGVYNRGLVGTIAGSAERADRDLALALDLSPLDPLAYAMVSARALTHVQFGDFEKAASFGVRAAKMPGAHKHIELIAALTSHLAGNAPEAGAWLGKARSKDPQLSAAMFFNSFPYAPTAAREVVERALYELGL